MTDSVLTLSPAVQRQYILGQQGLYPGRRWRGKAGVEQAIHAGSVVQVDPLNVVARSHDIVLYGRVLDYRPALLDELLYTDRAAFDYGGTVMIAPLDELPYWRVVMERKRHEKRWEAFAAEHGAVIDAVRADVRAHGPRGTRDLEDDTVQAGTFRSGKISARALYYCWLAGDLMTHSRRGFDRLYDLRERIAPPALHGAASPDEADAFFARRIFDHYGLLSARSWRNVFQGTIERRVERAEAEARLASLREAGAIAAVTLESDPKLPRYVLSDHLPLLDTLLAGRIPEAWAPLETTTQQEAVFLAPLEIVSTRGRALPLFGFEYLWEVYKPQEKRRWGYYTLPVLYGDQLVARFDPKLERASGTLVIKGFWLEDGVTPDDDLRAALHAGMERFMTFVGADALDVPEAWPGG